MKKSAILIFLLAALPLMAQAKPNVILIMTDDQGYGDITAHGHPHLRTPNMDRLHRDGVRLENRTPAIPGLPVGRVRKG